MGVTAGAVLKKIAIHLLTEKKTMKTVVDILLVIIIAAIMPAVAVVGMFSGDIDFDKARLQEIIIENLSEEEKELLKHIEDTMYAIEDAMQASDFSSRVKEAQVLYVFGLSDYSFESDFVSKLSGCFVEGQTDKQLIAAVNASFGTDLIAEDFTKVMNSIRDAYIDTSTFVDSTTKNNLDLVEWAKQAYASGWGYVWGTYGMVLNESILESLMEMYPDEVGNYESFIREHWMGGRTADCNGLIKGYGWYNVETGEIELGANGMPQITADIMYAAAIEKGMLDTIPEIPGLAVWKSGHIGIYIGDGQVIQAAGTKAGVIQTLIEDSGWTHWLKIPYINYLQENTNE